MKLNDFIRAITALCKEEQNPDIVDDYGLSVVGVDYVDGNIVLTFDDPKDEIVEPEEDTLVLKIV